MRFIVKCNGDADGADFALVELEPANARFLLDARQRAEQLMRIAGFYAVDLFDYAPMPFGLEQLPDELEDGWGDYAIAPEDLVIADAPVSYNLKDFDNIGEAGDVYDPSFTPADLRRARPCRVRAPRPRGRARPANRPVLSVVTPAAATSAVGVTTHGRQQMSGFCKGSAYVGISLWRVYVGWQYNLPLRRLLFRFDSTGGSRRHVWIGPLYLIVG
jgi:hypothetical protein